VSILKIKTKDPVGVQGIAKKINKDPVGAQGIAKKINKTKIQGKIKSPFSIR